MPTPATLIVTAPAPTRGVPTQLRSGKGQWRFVMEMCDPSQGSSAVWHDITCIDERNCYVLGYELTRGASEFGGRYSAAIAEIEMLANDDSLAPWNGNTAPTFGVHVDLGAGLIIRAGFIRVKDGTTVQWFPRFTHRVESWGDSTYGRNGEVRRHPITTRDLMTGLVNVPVLEFTTTQDWAARVDAILDRADWEFPHTIYGATGVLNLTPCPESDSAISELDATTDPTGIVYYTHRNGTLIFRPMLGDQWHASQLDDEPPADGTAYPTEDTITFSYLACDDGYLAYALDEVGEPFGFDDTELTVVNHVHVSDDVDPDNPFSVDDPVSIQRYGRKTRNYSWRVPNDPVANRVVTFRAYASKQARPLTTTIDLDNFFPSAALLDYMTPVVVKHSTAPGRRVVTGTGAVQSIIERVRPRIANQQIDWDLTCQVDVFSKSETDWLNPVETLSVSGITDSDMTFSWTLPATQPMTPTNIQYRLSNSSVWVTIDYPTPLSVPWHGLDPETPYEFNVRIIRIEADRIVAVSPTKRISGTTLAAEKPIKDDDDIEVPTDPNCATAWEFQRTDDLDETFWEQIWETIESGTLPPGVSEFTPDPDWYEPGYLYRVRTREMCEGEDPGPWVYSDPYTHECQVDSSVGDAPYADPSLVAFWPKVCPNDKIHNAVTNYLAGHGPAWGGVSSSGVDEFALRSGSDTAGEILNGDDPAATGFYESASIGCVVSVGYPENATLLAIPGMQITCAAAGGGGWTATARVVTYLGESVSIDSPELDLIFPTFLFATYDSETGTLKLYVDSVEVGSETLEDPGDRMHSGTLHIGAPRASTIADIGVWDAVLVLTPAIVPVTINQHPTQPDPTSASVVLFEAVFAEAVTGFVGTDVDVSGTAGPLIASVSTVDNITWTISVSGMISSGTVIASIPAGVCTSTASGAPNDASTSTDNVVDYTTTGATRDAMLAAGPLAMWDYVESGFPIDDLTTAATTDNLTTFTGTVAHAFQSWIGPDNRRRATVYARSFITANPSSTDLSFSGGGGRTFVALYGYIGRNSNVIVARRGHTSGSDVWRVGYDGTQIYVRYGRTDSSGAWRTWVHAMTPAVFEAIHVLYVYMPGDGIVPTLRVNGVALTMTLSSGPTGTQDISSANAMYVPGGSANYGYAYLGPAAIYNGALDPTAIEAAAASEGWLASAYAYVSDTFDRANGALGAKWNAGASALINGNRVQVNSGGSLQPATYVTGAIAPDHYSEIDIASDSVAPTSGNQHHLRVRSNNSANYYAGGWRDTSGGQFVISRNGSVDIATAAGAYPAGSRMRFEAVGTALSLYVDDVLVCSGTDATYSGVTQNHCGFGAWGDATHPARFDNYVHGVL